MAAPAVGLRQATVAAALALLVGGLGVALRPPWHDELYTLELAARPAPAIVAALRLDSGPPGHYLLARAVWLAGGRTARALRLPSLLALAAALAALAAVAARRLGPGAGWWVAVAAPLHPVALAAATEARAYGVLLLAASVAAVAVSGRLGRWRAVALAAALAVACWVHALGLLLALAVALAAAFRPRPERLRAWAAVAAALALHLPWVPVMLAQPPAALAWMARTTPRADPRVLLVPLAAATPAVDLSPWLDLAGVPGMGAVAPLVGLALLAAGLRRRELRPALALWWGAAGAVLLASAAIRPAYYPGRGDALWLPAALLVAGAVLAGGRRPGRVVAAAACGVGVAAAALTLSAWAVAPPGPAASAAAALARLAAPGDTVVTTGWWALAVRWRLGERAAGFRWLTFPPAAAAHPGWYDDAEATAAAARELGRRLAPLAAAGRRIWLLRSPALPSDRRLDPVAGSLGLVPRARGGRFWVLWGPPG